MGDTLSGRPRRERRGARRWIPQELPWPLACRVTPGHDALIVNLSAVGVLVETDTPLKPGRPVTVHLLRPSRRVALGGRVVRCSVAALDRAMGPMYRAGIAFARWFEPLWELDSLNEEDDVLPSVALGREDGKCLPQGAANSSTRIG